MTKLGLSISLITDLNGYQEIKRLYGALSEWICHQQMSDAGHRSSRKIRVPLFRKSYTGGRSLSTARRPYGGAASDPVRPRQTLSRFLASMKKVHEGPI